jgi:hypothetical protein
MSVHQRKKYLTIKQKMYINIQILTTKHNYSITLGIIDQHYALIIIPLFIITQAPTCFDTYVSSSGNVFYSCELLKVRNCCVIRMYPCTVNVGVHRMLWFRALLCAQLDNIRCTPTFTVQRYIPMTQQFRTFSNSQG